MGTWNEKRLTILKRDNYTCQVCKQFNPELGTVEFYDDVNGYIELHTYTNCPDPFGSIYSIAQSKTGLTFDINFGNCWPVFPIMQVHHKKYINGKENWDYNDEDLVTLCKKCHLQVHLNHAVPIYSVDDVLLEEREFVPVDVGVGRKHNCEEWRFIQQIGGGEYVVSNISPTITMVLFQRHNKEEAEEEGKLALEKLIKNFFPLYSKTK